MDLPWGSDLSKMFVTNIGFITTEGPNGPDIMACEWTHHISYKPGMIAICVHPNDATAENILTSKEFGVNIAASDQNVFSSIAGGSSGHSVDKIKVLQEMGFEFFPTLNIKTLMVKGAAANIECKLVGSKSHGDHTMFIGEVVDAQVGMTKTSLIYSGGKYWKFGEQVMKPGEDVLNRIKALTEKHRK